MALASTFRLAIYGRDSGVLCDDDFSKLRVSRKTCEGLRNQTFLATKKSISDAIKVKFKICFEKLIVKRSFGKKASKLKVIKTPG